MRVRVVAFLVAAVVAAFGFALSVSAQGVIVPIICERRPCIPRPVPQLPSALPVKSIKLDTKINGQIATTHVEQVFRNDTQFTLEGTYFFPIPDTASITEFAIWENGKKLVGEVRTKEEARRIYDEIVRRQRDPGLLEYAGKNLFQASIFPIPPQSDKKLEITYTEILKAESGTVAYRYLLGTGRNVWQRQWQETARPNVKQQFGTISGTVEIVGREAIRNVYSPTHQIDIKRKGETSAIATFETKNSDSDFQLFFGLSNSEFGMTLITHREPGKDGYFLLSLSPNDDLADTQIVNKDIVFVLDTSGSMAEEGKMEKARKALLFGIKTLRDGDRFNVINFAGEERLMERNLINADADGKKHAEEFVNRLNPTGGTNINDSLIASLKQFDKNGRPKILVFMTDGLPTVGVRDVDKIVQNVREAKDSDVRIFPFGFGYDVNTALLDKLGSENGGISDYVQPREDLEVKVSNFFTKVSSPVLSDIEIDFNAVIVESMYPRKMPDLFRGMQLTLIGRYRNTNDLQNILLRLTGKTARETKSYAFPGHDFPVRNDENDFLPRLWASRRVGWLVEQLRASPDSKEIRDELIDLGTRYGLVTPFTSYLATDGTVVNFARSVEMERRMALPAAKSVRDQSGEAAVRQSAQQNTMQMNAQVVNVTADGASGAGRGRGRGDTLDQIVINNSRQNQFVANRNFINQDGVWTDSEFNPQNQQTTDVRFGSDEYFALLTRERGLAPYLSLGEQVVVVWKGRAYRVVK